jgi:hypothetical protein
MMVNGEEKYIETLPKHELFREGSRWNYMLCCSSYYFTGTNNTNLIDNRHNKVLHIDTDFKNYGDEIDLFLDWITLYIDCDEKEFLGYSRYEEYIIPDFYFYENKKIVRKTLDEMKIDGKLNY